jgi:SAM-dependent methyltransferase
MRFDEEASRRIEAIYRTPDIVAQRDQVLAALSLLPGEHVADLGCGPGLLAEQMLGAVGENGSVEGIDTSDSMIAIAQRRCGEFRNVHFGLGDVAALPYEDERFDVAVCTQVYEYVPDIDLALRELRRVLKPGARAVIVDTDWESCVWHSGDAPRMRQVLDAWDLHCAHPHLPRELRARLERAGLQQVRCEALVLLNARFDPDTYSHAMIAVIERYADKRLGGSVARDWANDLRERAARGQYFFSLNRYLFKATRA